MKPFWVQPTITRPPMKFGDFFKAERYAIHWLHRLKGEEVSIKCGASLVAYCRLSHRGTAVTYVTPQWSAVINIQAERLKFSKKRIRNFNFIDSHLQINLPV
jgi:hypothetical protein